MRCCDRGTGLSVPRYPVPTNSYKLYIGLPVAGAYLAEIIWREFNADWELWSPDGKYRRERLDWEILGSYMNWYIYSGILCNNNYNSWQQIVTNCEYVSYILNYKTYLCVISDFSLYKKVSTLLLFKVNLTPLELFYYTRGEIIPTAG